MADIKTCHLYLQYLYKCLVDAALKAGYIVTCTSAYRTIAEQAEIYAQGRTKPGDIISDAPAGKSMHNFKWAFDVKVIEAKTKKATFEGYMKVGAIGKKLGLFWGYDFIVNGKPFHDKPHFQWTNGIPDHDIYNHTKTPVDPAEEYQETINKYKDNYKAEIDRLNSSNDSQKGMKIFVLNLARDAKIAAQNAKK